MAYTQLWYGHDPKIGVVKLTDIDTTGPGPFNLTASSPTYGRNVSYWEIMQGHEPVLGNGEFVYVKNTSGSTLTVGNVVQFGSAQDSSNNMIVTVTPWTGTANSGMPLGVAISAIPNNNWGWVQVGGNAIASTNGTVTVGNPLYWQANGVVSNVAVASKQMLNAQAATAGGATLGSGNAGGTLAATNAVILIERPGAQGAIT